MSNVIKLQINTRVDLLASEMLANISSENPDHVFLIVWPNDGSMPSYHSTTSDIQVILMQLNRFIHKYYNGDFDDE